MSLKIGRMPLSSRFWADLHTTDFAQLDPAATVALLPVGPPSSMGRTCPWQSTVISLMAS
jgi:creatinine amidohydrolase